MDLDRNRWVFWELHSKISLQLSCKSHRRLAAKVTEAEEDKTIYNCLVKAIEDLLLKLRQDGSSL